MLVQTRRSGECLILMTKQRRLLGVVAVAGTTAPVKLGLAFEKSVDIVRQELTGWADLSAEDVAHKPIGTPVPEAAK